MEAKSQLSVQSWDEKKFQDINEHQRMTQAQVVFECAGTLQGKASVTWLMYYNLYDEVNKGNSMASYLGLIRFEGSLDGRHGSFVMEDEGTFLNGKAESTLSIVEFSGLDGLQNISGTGKFISSPDGSSLELSYHFNDPQFTQLNDSGSDLLN